MIMDLDRREDHRKVEILTVTNHRDQLNLRMKDSMEVMEVILMERQDDLTHAISAKIEKYQRVAVEDLPAMGAARLQNRDPFHEFISDARFVIVLQRHERILRCG